MRQPKPPLFYARVVEGATDQKAGDLAAQLLPLRVGEYVGVTYGPTHDGWCGGFRLADRDALSGWFSCHYVARVSAAGVSPPCPCKTPAALCSASSC